MQELLNAIAARTDESEVFGLDTTVNLVGFENNRLKSLNTLRTRGAAIRAKLEGKLGQCFASDLRDPGRLAEHVRDIAAHGDVIDYGFAGPAEYPRLDLVDPAVERLTMEEIVRQGEEAVAVLTAYDPHIHTTYMAERTLDRVQVLTSNGAGAEYERMFFSHGIIAELVEGKNILRMARYAKGIHPPISGRELAEILVGEMQVARHNVSFKPGKLRVIFAPASFADVLMAFTGAVDGNLVARGVSPLTERLGEQILDPRITILDDPLHPNGIMSAPSDDEGTPCRTKAIVEQGVLKLFLADRKAAVRLGVEPTGSSIRVIPFERYKSFAVNLGIEFQNLIMAPGERSIDQLRADTEYGVEVHQINGILLGDLIGGDFSGSLELAYLIRNGERVGRIKDAMISGNFFKIFKDQLVDISAEQEWSGTFGGCSGSFLLPWIVADGVDVSGLH
jgi:PmbA protein